MKNWVVQRRVNDCTHLEVILYICRDRPHPIHDRIDPIKRRQSHYVVSDCHRGLFESWLCPTESMTTNITYRQFSCRLQRDS